MTRCFQQLGTPATWRRQGVAGGGQLSCDWISRSCQPSACQALYDSTRSTPNEKNRETVQGDKAVQQLASLVRSWLGPLVRDLPNLDSASFTERFDMPDDIIAAGRALVDVVERHQAGATTPLPYGNDVITSLRDATAAAEKEWSEAQSVLGGGQELLARTRVAAAALQKELVAFRRSLRAVIGTSHRDYQKLRSARVLRTDPEDTGENGAPTGGSETSTNSPGTSAASPTETTSAPATQEVKQA